ncbi:hypothetical protein [Halorubrum tebenquichense]|uniref:Uncharacterized protein n=1 Tax=Halorubrum tebenquichense DSM 14210 TaxID=1227485 RepID=M0DY54_9EURY|nr:hypothetical protein [Halorubrum tebenquichense]ELZ38999.1 hypothetical protein C472_05641 [Halorubrum tebenquichense DSM 14210]
MASSPPAHGSGAQTTEFTVDTIAEGIHSPGEPESVTATAEVEAAGGLLIAVETDTEFPDWRLDARIVNGDVEVRSGYREGERVDEVPTWLARVLNVVGDRMLEGSS